MPCDRPPHEQSQVLAGFFDIRHAAEQISLRSRGFAGVVGRVPAGSTGLMPFDVAVIFCTGCFRCFRCFRGLPGNGPRFGFRICAAVDVATIAEQPPATTARVDTIPVDTSATPSHTTAENTCRISVFRCFFRDEATSDPPDTGSDTHGQPQVATRTTPRTQPGHHSPESGHREAVSAAVSAGHDRSRNARRTSARR